MSGRDRRPMRSLLVAMMALVLIAAVSIALSVANARSTSSSVRAALLPIITALSQAEAIDTTDLLPDGVTPPPPVAQAIERTALAYLAAIDTGDWEAAWALTDPESRGGIEMDGWALPRIAEAEGSGLESRWHDGMLPLLMMGADAEMGRIVTEEMSGWVELTVRTAVPGTLVLRRAGEDWALDLEATRQIEARDAVRRQLKALSQSDDDPSSFFRAMIMMEGDGLGALALTELALSRQMQAEFHVEQVRATDDRAIVRVKGESIIRVAMPLANGDRGWSLAWCRAPVFLDAEVSFEDAVAGTLRAPMRGRDASQICRSNLKQLALGMLMYTQDYDEHFPPADRWCSAVYPYTRNRAIFSCPADDADFSYAFNYKLSRQYREAVGHPAGTIMLHESEIGRGNAFDWPDYPGSSLPIPGRHDGLNNYAWVDGSVSMRHPDHPSVQADAYRLGQQPPPRRSPMDDFDDFR